MIDTASARETYGTWLLALLALTILRLTLATTIPLAPDEAYYWLWSRHLQPGYYDHPPMVALFIRAGTLLAGPTAFGIRLLGPLSRRCRFSLALAGGGGFQPESPCRADCCRAFQRHTLRRRRAPSS